MLTVDPPKRIVWRTIATPLFVDSTEWSIHLEPAVAGTRIVQEYRLTRCPRWWEWIAHPADPGSHRPYRRADRRPAPNRRRRRSRHTCRRPGTDPMTPPPQCGHPHRRRLGHLPARRRHRRPHSVPATPPRRPPPPAPGQSDQLADRPAAVRAGAAAGRGGRRRTCHRSVKPGSAHGRHGRRTRPHRPRHRVDVVGLPAGDTGSRVRARNAAPMAVRNLHPADDRRCGTAGRRTARRPHLTALAWASIVADLTFLAAYLSFSDLPPFVFYLLFPAIAVVL